MSSNFSLHIFLFLFTLDFKFSLNSSLFRCLLIFAYLLFLLTCPNLLSVVYLSLSFVILNLKFASPFMLFSSLYCFTPSSPCPLYLLLVPPQFSFFLSSFTARSVIRSLSGPFSLSMSLFPLHYFLASIRTVFPFPGFLHFELACPHQSGFRFGALK